MELYTYMQGKPEDGVYTGAFMASREKLAALAPEIIARNTGCPYDKSRDCFEIESFDRTFEVSYQNGAVYFKNSELVPERSWRLILLNYFSKAKNLPLSGRWISYKDQPGGSVFYPHIRSHIIEPMGKCYDSWEDEKLVAALKDLGFTLESGQGDLCAKAWFAPRIPLRVIFWRGDEDFPGAFQILFDSTVSDQMHIEDSASLCNLVMDFIQAQIAEKV